MIRRGVALVLALTGCDEVFDVTHVEPPGEDPCNAMAMVPDTITLTGMLLDSATNAPIVNATVDATPGPTTLTSADGAFTLPVPTGGAPLVTALAVTSAAGYPAYSMFYQRPFTQTPSDVSSKLLATTVIDSLYGRDRAPGRGTALISLRDCAGNGIPGAHVELEPAAQIEYQGGGTATDGTGLAYALDVEAATIATHAGGAKAFSFTMQASGVAIVYLVQP